MSLLRQKAIKGVTWSFIDNLANSGITFLVGLILARLLSPAEFGILGMITVFIAVANSFIDSGFSQALIRKNDATTQDYNTVFFFNLSIGIAIFLLLYLLAPAISIFFKEPKLKAVTRAMGIFLVVSALAIIPKTILTKSIDFKTQAKISLVSSLSSGAIGVGMAYYQMGVWSLVGQVISRQLLNTVLLWIASPWRPSREFSMTSLKGLYRFGSNLLVAGLLETIYKNIYYLIIGRFYSASQLGQYTRAELFATAFSSNLSMVVQRVSYPALSAIQHDNQRLKEAYRKVIKSTMLPTFALMMGLAAVARPLILILIGEKWLQAAAFLQILCLAEMFYPLHAINLNALNVKGRSDLFLKLEIIKKSIAIPVIGIGIWFGITYMLWGSVLLSVIAYFLNSHFSGRLLHYSTREQIRDLAPGFLVAALVASIMWGISFMNFLPWITLLLQCITGVVLSIVIYEILKLSEYLDLKQMLLTVIKK
ncbi:lipopolysaccharide biosynthesis protein [Chitinophaga solisilvae]|uniref:lipopolysaccharide biosynthesis protein n=1 Tax=Chitinophaga solisilvae TaxID=1233460 RepID=UPI001369FDB0|nr:lipopolysaccharide biosynthesis protein [Chitinophaga solisilvae]